MALRLGDEAPNFTAETTEGTINFHEWLGNGWGILFSHPKDFTPVCTTELGTMAKIIPEFKKRNVKVLAISVDPIDSHKGWIKDINETQNCTVSYPIIADPEKKVAQLYDMIHPERARQYDGAFGVHYRPRQEGEVDADVPGIDRPKFRRTLARRRFAAAHCTI